MPTAETFWEQIATFNEVTFPVQIAMVALALLLTLLVIIRPGNISDILMKTFLFLAFMWNGIVYFWFFEWNILSMISSILYIIVAILFFVDIFRNKTSFRLPAVNWRKYVTIFLILIVFLYPVIGMGLGRYYPQTCMPMAPCPLTIFTIALITGALPHSDRKVYFVLLILALLNLPKCLGLLECYQDCILFAVGIYALVLLIKHWDIITVRQR